MPSNYMMRKILKLHIETVYPFFVMLLCLRQDFKKGTWWRKHDIFASISEENFRKSSRANLFLSHTYKQNNGNCYHLTTENGGKKFFLLQNFYKYYFLRLWNGKKKEFIVNNTLECSTVMACPSTLVATVSF